MTGTARIAAAPISWGVIEVPDWGVQLRPDRVLAEMAELGVTATEFGPEGFLPDDPDDRAQLLADYGLHAVGGFFPAVLHRADEDPIPAIERELEAYVTAGAGTLVLAAATGRAGYDGKPELLEAEWATLFKNLDRALAVAERVGVVATLHQHMGTMVESPSEVARVLAESDIGLCLDTGHLTLGGVNPLEIAQEHASRVSHTHLKDVNLEVLARVRSGELSYREGVRQGMFRPLGAGDACVADIVAELRRAGYDGWYVLEQDTVLNTEADAVSALKNTRHGMEFIAQAVST